MRFHLSGLLTKVHHQVSSITHKLLAAMGLTKAYIWKNKCDIILDIAVMTMVPKYMAVRLVFSAVSFTYNSLVLLLKNLTAKHRRRLRGQVDQQLLNLEKQTQCIEESDSGSRHLYGRNYLCCGTSNLHKMESKVNKGCVSDPAGTFENNNDSVSQIPNILLDDRQTGKDTLSGNQCDSETDKTMHFQDTDYLGKGSERTWNSLTPNWEQYDFDDYVDYDQLDDYIWRKDLGSSTEISSDSDEDGLSKDLAVWNTRAMLQVLDPLHEARLDLKPKRPCKRHSVKRNGLLSRSACIILMQRHGYMAGNVSEDG